MSGSAIISSHVERQQGWQGPRSIDRSWHSDVLAENLRRANCTVSQPPTTIMIPSTALMIVSIIAYFERPAKPIKHIDNRPAKMSAMAVPLTISGVLASSSFSRKPAISTSASVKPTPAPNA